MFSLKCTLFFLLVYPDRKAICFSLYGQKTHSRATSLIVGTVNTALKKNAV